ncbi:MAG TPA: C4-dicarboxylate transporter DctA, partial [Sphingobacterium sp.]|nr:C4-dicarboxylate transporter DctA [Sphingobacterium sp.]
MDFIIGIIPGNVIAAVASDNMLQVLVFAVLFGIGMTKIGQKACEPELNVLQSFLKVLFSIIKMIMYLAPIGAMGAMGFTIGKFGIQALSKLGMLMLSFYLTCFIFVIIVIGAVLYFYLKVHVFKF